MRAKKLMPYCLAALLAGCVPDCLAAPAVYQGNDCLRGEAPGDLGRGCQPAAGHVGIRPPGAERRERLPAELRDALAKCYRLNIADKEGRKGSFAACLVKLQDKLFLDVMPDRFPSGEQDPEQMRLVYNAFFFMPVHSFVRVSSIGDQLRLRLTDDEGFKKLLEAEPKVVKYDVIDDRPVLTASTEELQAFVAKYADDERLFPSEVTLTRKSK